MNSNPLPLFSETFDFLIRIAEFGQDQLPSYDKMKRKTISWYLDSKISTLQDRKISVGYVDNNDTLVNISGDTTIEDFGASPKLVVSCLESTRLFSIHRIVTGRSEFNKTLKLRLPQENALWGMKQALVDAPEETANANEARRFMVILPTGCGKTRVIALAPFMLQGKSVLIIAPGVPIRDQLVQILTEYFHTSEFAPIFKDGGVPSVAKLDITGAHQHADIYVANIQSLVQSGTPPVVVRETVQTMFKRVKFDVCLVDEGHHGPADSWAAVEKELLTYNSRCRIVLLTATPQRGDGRTYGLKDESCYYLYRRAEATREKYIKETKFHDVDISAVPVMNCEDETYLMTILGPAVTKLQELRASCGGLPLRMLITTQHDAKAKRIAELFNTRSEEQNWGLNAAAITGNLKDEEKHRRLRLFAERDVLSGTNRIIDVGVQCQMLGEGYDNDLIAVSVFVSPAKSVSKLSQYHGRAVRVPREVTKHPELAQLMQAHLFYPHRTDCDIMDSVVKEYREGADETTASLFDSTCAFKSCEDAHRQLNKLSTDDFVAAMRDHFVEYHDKYTEIRSDWRVIPAEYLADYVFAKYIGDDATSRTVSIVDFGCGDVGLFESQLLTLVKGRTDSGVVHVTVCARDVVALHNVDEFQWAQPNGTFRCDTIAGNYCADVTPGETRTCYDIGVFCLSMMAKDALEHGLKQAAKVIRPGGDIFIVQDIYKFGLLPRTKTATKEATLAQFRRLFREQTMFECVAVDMIPNSVHVLVHLRNVTCDLVETVEKLIVGVSFKSLAAVSVAMPPTTGPTTSSTEFAAAAPAPLYRPPAANVAMMDQDYCTYGASSRDPTADMQAEDSEEGDDDDRQPTKKRKFE